MLDRTLKYMLMEQDMTLQELADLSNVPMETLRNIYYGKVNNPKVGTVYEISRALNVSMNYLMGSSDFGAEELKVIENYRKSGDHGKSMIRFISEFEADAAKRERKMERAYVITCLIPQGNVIDGMRYSSCDMQEITTCVRDAYMAIEITTNYFSPMYCKGDRVLLENRFPDSGEHALFLDGERAFLRHFFEKDGVYELKCLNGRGHDIFLKRMDQMRCVGTCSGVIRS